MTLLLVCKRFNKEIINKKRYYLYFHFNQALRKGDYNEAVAIRQYSILKSCVILIDTECLFNAGLSGSKKCIEYLLEKDKGGVDYWIIDVLFGLAVAGHKELALDYCSSDRYDIYLHNVIWGLYYEHWRILNICILNCYDELFLKMCPSNYDCPGISEKLLPETLDRAPDKTKTEDFIIKYILRPISEIEDIDSFEYFDMRVFLLNLIKLKNARLIREVVDLKIKIHQHVYDYIKSLGDDFDELVKIIKKRNSRNSRRRRARKAKDL